ncbi:MAG: tol-pal system protein YbgF [Endomicrobia bacterium]|nr:tol-pal system protein YbgF [Endomicrobiia bacterium]
MRYLTVFSIFFVFAFSACIPSGNQEVTDLKGEVAQMQIQFKELQRNHADLYAKADTEFVTLDVLAASVQDLQNKVSALTQKIQDLEAVSKKGNRDSGDAVLPSDIYQNAYSDYSMGKYDLAFNGFQSFVDKYPNAELASQALYFMGECFYSRSKWQAALDEYQKVEQIYPKSDQVSPARLKIALCYELLGKKSQAMNVFGSIVKDFPQSSEALTAKEKIRIYNNAQKK